VRAADLARPDPAATAAEEAGLARVVVGREERRSHDQVVRFIPPLNIAEDDLRIGVRAFVQAAQAEAVGAPA